LVIPVAAENLRCDLQTNPASHYTGFFGQGVDLPVIGKLVTTINLSASLETEDSIKIIFQ
jgi:hypothetical protein